MMSEEAIQTELPGCPHCGHPYRPPRWGRDYACAACGKPLTATGRSPVQVPVWSLYSLAAVLMVGVVVRFSADRLQQRAQAATRLPEARAEPVQLPPKFADRLRQKLACLEQDLQVNPEEPVLLTKAGECCLYLAVLHHDAEPATAEKWRGRARRYAERVQRIVPHVGEQLWRDAENPWGMRWADGPNGTIASALLRGRKLMRVVGDGDQRIGFPSLAGLRSGLPLGMGSGMGGPGLRLGPGPGGPSIVMPNAPGNGPAFGNGPPHPGNGPPHSGNGPAALGSPYAGYPPNGPGLSGVPSVVPRPAPSAAVAVPGTGVFGDRTDLDVLRQRYRESADDEAAAALTAELERLAEIDGRRAGPDPELMREAMRPYLHEAARVYAQAAGDHPLRCYRALFYLSAADIYGRLREWDEQLRMLQAARDAAPYASGIWRDLALVCLRAGRTRESRRAYQESRAWLFPGLRPSIALR